MRRPASGRPFAFTGAVDVVQARAVPVHLGGIGFLRSLQALRLRLGAPTFLTFS
jgi:hypothetical protein